jgi:hypothetical protein
MQRLRFVATLFSLVGSVLLFRAYYLVSFATGYGITKADLNQRLFLAGGVVCGVVFLALSLRSLFGTKSR